MVPTLRAAVVFAAVTCGTYALLDAARARSRRRAVLQQLVEYGEGDDRDRRLLDPVLRRIAIPIARWAARLGRASTPTGYVAGLRQKLALAGRTKPDALDRFLAGQVLSLAGGAASVSVAASLAPLRGTMRWSVLGLIVLASALGPRAALERSAARRQRAIRAGLPNVVDLLAVSVEAGFGLDQALERVTADATGPLDEELRRLQGDMRAGASRAAALRALVDRTDLPELPSFVSAIVQTEVLGVPIAPVLRAQSEEMRVRRRQRAQAQAQKAPVKMLFPMVLCIFPALFVVVLGPAALQIGDAFR